MLFDGKSNNPDDISGIHTSQLNSNIIEEAFKNSQQGIQIHMAHKIWLLLCIHYTNDTF